MNKNKPTQMQLFYEAQKNIGELHKQFMDVMNSDNPLTKDEIKKMMDKHPGRYNFMKGWVK